MSIKIYDAYRTKMPLYQLMDKLREKRFEVQTKAIDYLADIYKLESYLIREKEENFFFYHDVLKKEILPKITESILSPYYSLDAIDCSVVLYFPTIKLKGFSTKNILLQTFGNWSNEINFTESDGFYDFHYQNQSDEPENMTVKEWNTREKVWCNVFDDYTLTPSEAGLCFDIIHTSNLSTICNGLDAKYRDLKKNYNKEKE